MLRSHTILVCLVVLGTTSAAHADWGYYVDSRGNGNYELAGGLFNYDSALTEARRACQLGSRVSQIVNLATGQRYPFTCNARAPGKTLQQYKTEVENAYRRAADFRNWAQQNAGRLTNEQFNTVNQAINQYNSTLAEAQQAYGSSFTNYSRLSTIPSSWIAAQRYAINYRLRPRGSWQHLGTVTGLASAQKEVSSYTRRYPTYEFTYVLLR